MLVVDTIGLLSRIYGSADWSYVGGGFGAGIHNTLEPVVYGLPVAFGVKYHKYKEACDLISLGVAHSVCNAKALQEWFKELQHEDVRAEVNVKAQQYIAKHRGATEMVVNAIFAKENA